MVAIGQIFGTQAIVWPQGNIFTQPLNPFLSGIALASYLKPEPVGIRCDCLVYFAASEFSWFLIFFF
jgi:hypothetical protein